MNDFSHCQTKLFLANFIHHVLLLPPPPRLGTTRKATLKKEHVFLRSSNTKSRIIILFQGISTYLREEWICTAYAWTVWTWVTPYCWLKKDKHAPRNRRSVKNVPAKAQPSLFPQTAVFHEMIIFCKGNEDIVSLFVIFSKGFSPPLLSKFSRETTVAARWVLKNEIGDFGGEILIQGMTLEGTLQGDAEYKVLDTVERLPSDRYGWLSSYYECSRLGSITFDLKIIGKSRRHDHRFGWICSSLTELSKLCSFFLSLVVSSACILLVSQPIFEKNVVRVLDFRENSLKQFDWKCCLCCLWAMLLSHNIQNWLPISI